MAPMIPPLKKSYHQMKLPTFSMVHHLLLLSNPSPHLTKPHIPKYPKTSPLLAPELVLGTVEYVKAHAADDPNTTSHDTIDYASGDTSFEGSAASSKSSHDSPPHSPPAREASRNWRSVLAQNASPRAQRRTWAFLALALILGSFTLLDSSSGFGLLRPGPVVNLTGAVSGTAVRYPADSDGWFAFTTVEVVELSYLEWVRSLLTGESATKLSEDVGLSPARAQMRESRETAARLAWFEKTSIVLPPDGVLVVSVLPDSPAIRAGVEPGDVLRAIDGEPIDGPLKLRELIDANPEGLTLTVDHLGELDFVKVYPRAGKIGVLATGSYAKSLDGLLAVETGSVGGSSAGLMMTLAILDVLYPGDLTGGLHIAGTGTIAFDGTVGPVAGVDYKIRAAAEAGAEWFLIPTSLVSDVSTPEGLRLVAVDTLDAALDAICQVSDDELCSSRQVVS